MSPSTPSLRLPSRSHSRRPASRPRASRNSSLASVLYLPRNPEALINPDGQIGEDAAELLQEFVHPHRHEIDATLVEEDLQGENLEGSPEDEDNEDEDDQFEAENAEWRQNLLSLPWWRRPSSLWFIILIPFSAVAMSATIGPRVEIYTQLACDAYKPEYRAGRGHGEPTNPVLVAAAQLLAPLALPDDKTYELCAGDPVVQKAVSKLSLTMITTMGILSCMTTAWWGSLSDRYGRTTVLRLATFGILITDFSFIMVSKFARVLPGGYWFLIVGPFLEGLLGGMTTASVAIHAYLADCTEPALRSRTFSLFLGLLFTGMSVGPTMASVLIRHTHNVLAVFYVAAGVHVVYALLIWCVIPESLSPAQMAQSRKLHRAEVGAARDIRSKGGAGIWARRAFGFLTPLALLIPSAPPASENPLKRPKRDWSLVLLTAGFGCVVMIMGSITSKMQYTIMMFGWTSEQIGYWTSLIGAARAIHLTIILPLAIKLFQPKTPSIQLPIEPDEPLEPATGSTLSSSTPARGPPRSPSRSRPPHHSPAFDLGLARVSLVLEVLAATLSALAPTGTTYTATSVLGAFGSGFGPAVNSIAATLYTRNGGKEIGRLFGALGVVQAICSQVIGPFIYGLTYMRTVATFPRAIFIVTVGALVTSLVLLSLIRIPQGTPVDEEESVVVPRVEREDTLVEARGPLIVIEDDTVEDEEGHRRKLVDEPRD